MVLWSDEYSDFSLDRSSRLVLIFRGAKLLSKYSQTSDGFGFLMFLIVLPYRSSGNRRLLTTRRFLKLQLIFQCSLLSLVMTFSGAKAVVLPAVGGSSR